MKGDAEVLRERAGIVEARLRGELRRHRDASDVLLAERLDRERRGDRRIDSAR